MKTIFLAHAYARTPPEFQQRMTELLKRLSALSPDLSVRGCIQYPEVPLADPYWIQTYLSELAGSDLVIALFDHESPALERIIRVRSASNTALWCFIPRGQLIPQSVSGPINEHHAQFQAQTLQHVYAYDTDGDIVRMVYRWLGMRALWMPTQAELREHIPIHKDVIRSQLHRQC